MIKSDLLKSQFATGRIGRREFMQGAAALGISAAAASGFMSQVQAATPVRGGHARLGMADGQTVDSMSVATWVNQHQGHTGMGVHDYLTVTDGENNLVPHLAESWESSDDAAQWVFHLRRGVEHSNGKTVDAHDVVASWNYHTGEDSTSSFKPQASVVKEARADGDHTVIFDLVSASADFAILTSDYHIPIMPSADGKPIDDTAGGAGPYILENFEPGISSKLTRNPNHWNDAVGHFDSAELIVILDAVARQNALVTGQVDMISAIDLKTADRLDAVDGLSVVQVEGRQHYTFPMRTDTAPFDDNNVRMALKHAIDREELVSKILRGRGSVGNDQPISSAYRFHDPDLEQRTYDPDKAKWYLGQAGLSSLSVTLSTADAAWSGAVDAATLFRETAAVAGIDLTIDRVPDDGFWSDTWMVKPWSACVWYGRLVADEQLTITYAEGGSWNDTFWSHERFNQVLNEARGTLDEALRREMYSELQRIIRDEGGQVIPLFANWVDAKSDKVGTPEQISAVQNLDGSRAVSRWWFNA
jgi:peptide/nickel transport system substrate-binding protein